MNYPPNGDVLSLNADSLTLTAECNHVLYKSCRPIVINFNKPHLETSKTNFIVISRKQMVNIPIVSINSIPIERVYITTFLGVHIDC